MAACGSLYQTYPPAQREDPELILTLSCCNFSGVVWFWFTGVHEEMLESLVESIAVVYKTEAAFLWWRTILLPWIFFCPLPIVWKTIPFCTQKKLWGNVRPNTWRPNVDSHPWFFGAFGETAAAVQISLSPTGQSAAYQPAYGLQWKTKRLLRGLGDNTKDYPTHCSCSCWDTRPPVTANVLIETIFVRNGSHLESFMFF